MLGRQLRRTGDACFWFSKELLCAAGEARFKLTIVFLTQVGDGTTTQRNTPVSVVGLSSGVAMVALGGVILVRVFQFVEAE